MRIPDYQNVFRTITMNGTFILSQKRTAHGEPYRIGSSDVGVLKPQSTPQQTGYKDLGALYDTADDMRVFIACVKRKR